ncbi:hypothetical protein GCM10027422_01650 [Hymenobacter arcticus]
MPKSVVLTVHAHRIDAAVQIPLTELQPAFGHAASDSSARLVALLLTWRQAQARQATSA